MATALDLINAIRTTASTEYQTRIPEATRTNIADVGNAITSFEGDKEVFLNTLVGKIITTIVNDKMYTNKLARFNKGNLEFGSTIEEVYTEIISSHAYNKDAVDVFAKNKPTVKALYQTSFFHSLREGWNSLIFPFDTSKKTCFFLYYFLKSS